MPRVARLPVLSCLAALSVGADPAQADEAARVELGVGGVTCSLEGYTETDLRMHLGLGLRRDFSSRFGPRVEAVDFVCPDSHLTGRAEHDLQVLMGVEVGL